MRFLKDDEILTIRLSSKRPGDFVFAVLYFPNVSDDDALEMPVSCSCLKIYEPKDFDKK